MTSCLWGEEEETSEAAVKGGVSLSLPLTSTCYTQLMFPEFRG